MDSDDRRYAQTHEWVSVETGVATVGVSQYAVDQLGDVVYLDLPQPGRALAVGDPLGDIESVKAVSQLYAPIAGEVLEVNAELESRPELVNESPLSEGWIVRLKPEDPNATGHLMDHAQYEKFIAEL